jgi:hypothetical protein
MLQQNKIKDFLKSLFSSKKDLTESEKTRVELLKKPIREYQRSAISSKRIIFPHSLPCFWKITE